MFLFTCVSWKRETAAHVVLLGSTVFCDQAVFNISVRPPCKLPIRRTMTPVCIRSYLASWETYFFSSPHRWLFLWTRVPALQASEESLASFAERYAVAATSVTKAAACLDLEKIEADAARLMATSDVEQSSEESSEEETSDEESSDEESSDEETSEDESSEDEHGSPGEDDGADETGVAEAAQAAAGAVPESSPKAPRTRKTGASTRTVVPSAAGPCGADVLVGTTGCRTNSGSISDGRGVERAESGSISTTASGDADQTCTSRGVERSADLLQLEALSSHGGAVEAGKGVSSTLASRLAVLSLEKQSTPLSAGGNIVGLGAENGANAPRQPPSIPSKIADNGSGAASGVEAARRGALIEEL